MKFKIPFTLSGISYLKESTKKFSKPFRGKGEKITEYLKSVDIDLTGEQYLGICLKTFFVSFFVVFLLSTSLLILFKISSFYIISFLISLVVSMFIFFIQFNYPRVYASHKTKNIEKNLIPAMEDFLVQLESGVPIYQIIINISNSNYGFVSYEFKRAVKSINSGLSQVEALENLIKRNNSNYFKRVLWQLSNGLRSGSDMSIVIKETIDNLNKEQTIQIQSYGSRLNPLVMFYMLIAVIIPSLGITFLTILGSMLGLSEKIMMLIFMAVYVIVIFIQIMFIGVIKSRRPSLL